MTVIKVKKYPPPLPNTPIFYLGTHIPSWLWKVDFPLFVSHRRLRGYGRFKAATCHYAVDSGAFSELSMFGQWKTTPQGYVDALHRYQDQIGPMDFAAPQDYMCEPFILNKTGMTVKQHQELTIDNYMILKDSNLPIIPVIQGYTQGDYEKHVTMYESVGIKLSAESTVGLGSICRRQNTKEISKIVVMLQQMNISLHGFGVKIQGLNHYGSYLKSVDSMAWSYYARNAPQWAGDKKCRIYHKNCANCIIFAQTWRERVVASLIS